MEAAPSRIFGPSAARSRGREATLVSALVHLLFFALLAAGLVDWLSRDIEAPPAGEGDMAVRFVASGGAGSSAAPVDDAGGASEPVEPTPEAEPVPPTPVAPRIPRPLAFEELVVPAIPREAAPPIETSSETPPLPRIESRGLGGLGPRTGPSTSKGSQLGPPGVSGGGRPHGGGDYDVDPVPIYKPDSPPYPKEARERMISGEVILEVLVKLDGSTEVVGVIKSLPHCVPAAIENARKWRWKPAIKDGKPVEAYGIITVTFDLFSTRPSN